MLLHFRSKNTIVSDNRLVPKSPISIILSTVRDYYWYCQDIITLPRLFYFILTAYLLSSSIFPPMLFQNPDAWDPDTTLGQTLRLFSFIISLSSIYTKYTQVVIDSVFNLVFIIIFSLPLIICSPIYKVNGRIPKDFSYVTTFCTDFLIYLAFLWTPSTLGTIVGLLITPSENQKTTSLVILLIFLFLLDLILYITFDTIFFPQVNFTKARTISWIGKTMTYFYSYISIILFLTRICEIIDNDIVRYILIFIYSLLIILGIIIVALNSPFINIKISSIFIGGSISSLVVLIFNVAQFGKENSDETMRITLFFVLFFVISLIAFNAFQNREDAIIKVLNDLDEDLLDFEDVFKHSWQFLLYMRIGFKNAHTYVLSFLPFETALKLWPKNSYIWMSYLRFMSVYYEETIKMQEIIELLKKQGMGGLHVKGFRSLLVRTLNIRDRQMSTELKQQFKLLDDQIRLTKNLLVTYWYAIIECSPSSAFDIGKQVNDNIQNLESIFSHLILLYPNNYHLLFKFANFYSSVVFDPKQGEYFTKRGTELKEQRNFDSDITQRFAFGMFPLLPKTLSDVHIMIQPTCSITLTNDEIGDIDFLDVLDSDNEDDDFESSRVRSLGLKAPVPFARNLIIFIFVFSIIVFCIGPFSASFYALNRVQTLKNYFNGISSSSKVVDLIEIISYYMLVDALRADDILFENQNIHNKTYLYSDVILKGLENLDIEYQNFCNFIETDIKVGSRSAFNQFRPSVLFLLHTTTNQAKTNTTIRLTLREGVSSLLGDFFLYSNYYLSIKESFYASDWLTESVSNSYQVTQPFLSFIFDICKDIRSFLDETYRNALIIVILFSIICIPFLIIGIILYRDIRNNWISIISIMNSLPESAIQNTISRFLRIKNLQMNDDEKDIEKQYTSTFIQMVTNRDSKNGLPIGTMIALLFFNSFFGIVVFVCQYFLIRHYGEQIVSIPFLLYSTSNTYVQFIQSAILSMRCYALYRNHPFWLDDRYVLIDSFNESISRLTESLNILLYIETDDFGTGIMGKSDAVSNGFFNSVVNWASITDKNEKLLSMPQLLTVNIVYQIITESYQTLINDHAADLLNDTQFAMIIHFTLEHFYNEIISSMNSNLDSAFDSLNDKLLIVIFAISVIVFIFGIFLMIFHYNQLSEILKTTRFCISSLSMIDLHCVSESPSILQLFSGNFADISNLDIERFLGLIQKVEDRIEDAIFLIDEDLNVVRVNKTAYNQYNLTEKTQQNPIDTFIHFENPQIMKTITDMLQKKIVKESTYETRVAKIDSEFPANKKTVHLKLVNNNATNNQLVILIAKQDSSKQKLLEIQKINKEIDDLKKLAIPNPLLGKVDLKRSSIKISVKNGITVYCNCPDLNYTANSDASQIRLKYKELYGIIEVAAAQSADACMLKTFNTNFLVCFNLLEQKYNLNEPVSEAISFSSFVISECQRKNINIKIGMGYDILAIAGMMSTNRLLFDYYGESRVFAMKLANSADNYTLLIHSNLFNFISNDYSAQMTNKVINDDGAQIECMQLYL